MHFLGLTLKAECDSEPNRKMIANHFAKLGFSGYFLMVWDLCAFARQRSILVQGRGSAANSAVCYALGITAVAGSILPKTVARWGWSPG